jgi:hypothetical protein
MNIRGLVLDDPEHSVHLQTLRYAPDPTFGSEDEVVGDATRLAFQSYSLNIIIGLMSQIVPHKFLPGVRISMKAVLDLLLSVSLSKNENCFHIGTNG